MPEKAQPLPTARGGGQEVLRGTGWGGTYGGSRLISSSQQSSEDGTESSPFYECGNRNTKRLGDLPKVTWPHMAELGILRGDLDVTVAITGVPQSPGMASK